MKRVTKAEELQGLKQKIENGRKVFDESDGRFMGMAIDISKEDSRIVDEDGDGIKPTKRMPERKTKQERLKAAKRRSQVSFQFPCIFFLSVCIEQRVFVFHRNVQ